MESLPDLNVAINPCKFHHSKTKIVVRKLFTNKQTNKQAKNKQTGVKTIPPHNFVLAEVMIILIIIIIIIIMIIIITII